MTAIELISKERDEQIHKHGYTVKYDLKNNTKYELILHAIYLLAPSHWTIPGLKIDARLKSKYQCKSTKEKLVVAGALIAAEIDRRSQKKKIKIDVIYEWFDNNYHESESEIKQLINDYFYQILYNFIFIK